MTDQLGFVQGDTAPDLNAIIHDEKDPDIIVDLTGCTVRFQMRAVDDKRYQVNAVASVTNGPAGAVSYSWGANDLSRPGTFLGQWEVTYLGGRVQTTYPEVEIIVRRQ